MRTPPQKLQTQQSWRRLGVGAAHTEAPSGVVERGECTFLLNSRSAGCSLEEAETGWQPAVFNLLLTMKPSLSIRNVLINYPLI